MHPSLPLSLSVKTFHQKQTGDLQSSGVGPHNYLQSSTDYIFSIPALFTMSVFPSLDFSCNLKEQSIKKKTL
jgi:hypothetical protein